MSFKLAQHSSTSPLSVNTQTYILFDIAMHCKAKKSKYLLQRQIIMRRRRWPHGWAVVCISKHSHCGITQGDSTHLKQKKSKFSTNLLGGNYRLGRQELTYSSGRIIHTLQPTAVTFHNTTPLTLLTFLVSSQVSISSCLFLRQQWACWSCVMGLGFVQENITSWT